MLPIVNRLKPALAVTLLIGLALGLSQTAWPTQAHGKTRRYAEVVTVAGSQLVPLLGAAPGELWVYMLHEGLWERLVAQMDEVNAQGAFVASEDGKLDGNDQVVFALDDYGTRRGPASWPAGIQKDFPEVEVKVTDPLDPEFEAIFYVFRSTTGPDEPMTPFVTYDPQARRIQGRSYTLGLANPDTDGFVGPKFLTLYKSQVNLVDRVKIRATIKGFGADTPVTENELPALVAALAGPGGPGLDTRPVITGPVRIVLDPTGASAAYGDRFALFPGLANLPSGGTLPIQVADVRVSLDFSKAAVPATYQDANLKEPVNVDGKPEVVPAQPLPLWRELTFIDGRTILLADDPTENALVKVYYKDDEAVDPNDTGDQMSYCDTGVTAPTLDDIMTSGFPGEMVVLPVGRNVTAQQLAENRRAKLVVTTTGSTAPTPGTPPTPRPATPVPTRPTSQPTATPTPHIPLEQGIYLPSLRRGQQ